MSKKLIYLVSFVLVLGVAGNASADLVAHWKLDEGSGNTVYDSSTSGNDGTFEGDPQWVAGYYGGALEFDGTDDNIDCGNDDSLNITDEITLSAWINMAQRPDVDNWYTIPWKEDAYSMYLYGTENTVTTLCADFWLDTGRADIWNGPDIDIPPNDWTHIAVTFNGTDFEFYVNGEHDYTQNEPGTIEVSAINFLFTQDGSNFEGLIDDVRLYNRALTQAEILAAMEGGEGYPYAMAPVPADGALLTVTWVSLGWRAGDFAVSHDVYMGENFDDVNDGTPDSSGFRGNQTSTDFFVGFFGNPYPDGLVPGTTYYWRIDEVNDTDPNSPWKGPVWSFWIQPRIAYGPTPAEGAKFVDPNADLNWSAGLGAGLHYVYFGDNFDDVNDAVGGPMQTATTYTPGTLELDKTYYWRVDESDDGITMLKGDVWSFTTAGLGGGVKGQYYHHDGATPHDPASLAFGTLVLTRTDPQINFQWGDFSPDPSINVDDFSVIWTGEVEAVFTETYTFYTNSDDGVKLWVDGQLIIENWTDHGTTENRGTIDLVGGQTYPIEMWFYERGGGAVAELRWSSPRTPKDLIPQAALSLQVKASGANPFNGAADVKQTATLSWRQGDEAASHQLYFGTDEEAVRNADTTSPEYKATKNLGSESYDPPGKLAWHTTYYWRVDEVNDLNPDSPWVGGVWSFTTADFLLVDDFEDYNDYEPDTIFDAWLDGWGVDTNGSEVGYAEPDFPGGEHFVETTTVHSGSQSMPYFYDTNFKYSEATYSPTQRDWTEEGVEVLSLWFYGDEANAAERMYVALNGGTAVYHDNANAVQIEEWTEWTIELQEFTGVDLTNVNTLAIGFGDKNNLQAGGTGFVLFDDIRLYRPAPEPEPQP